MSNIGSRTSCTIAITAATTAPVLGYYYASNIVLEESMMQVSFGLTTPPPSKSFLFFPGKKGKKSKTINTSASWDLRRVVA